MGLALELMPLLGACGGSSNSAASLPLNPAFAGDWSGTTTLELHDYWGPLAAWAIALTPSGCTLAIQGVCPDGTGEVDATGSSDFAQWGGSFSCAGVQSADCTSYVVTYTRATATLSPAPNQLTLVATGSTWPAASAGLPPWSTQPRAVREATPTGRTTPPFLPEPLF